MKKDKHQICCLDGDGISAELIQSCVTVINALESLLGTPIELDCHQVGFASLEKNGTTITDEVIAAARRSDGVILGPVSHSDYPPVKEGGLNPSGVLRKALSLYANIRPARSYEGISYHTQSSLDLVIVRENLEGFYADRNMEQGNGEFMPVEGVALAVRKITREASLNIARAGFELAQKRHQKKVTAVHKANVMRMTDGLFLSSVREVATEFGDIEYDEMLVDSAAAMLVRAPQRFDVIVTTNMFGDILSDLASELAGGLGLGGSLNKGKDISMAQAQHGSAPDIAGQDRANPVSILLSVAALLNDIGEARAARCLDGEISKMLASPDDHTADLGGSLSCSGFTERLAERLRAKELKREK